VPNRNWKAINIRTPADAFSPMTTNVATALEIDGDNAVHTGVIDGRTFELSRWVQPEGFFVLHRHRSGGAAAPHADLCLVRMSELFPHHQVVTVDQHDFQVYRRNRRERIPLICPRM
jgi:hypothetical protein